MIATFRYSDHAILLDKLEQLGVPVRRSTPSYFVIINDMDGNPTDNQYWVPAVTYAPEEEIGLTSTPQLVTTVGIVRSVILTDEQFALIPDVTSPSFLLDWDSETEDEDGNPLPWPMYVCEKLDDDGNIVQFQQSAGAFAT